KALTISAKGSQVKGWTGDRTAKASRWSDPPHVEFANLGYTETGGVAPPEKIRQFLKSYGGGFGLDDVTTESGEPLHIVVSQFQSDQWRIREAWRRRDHSLYTELGGGDSMGYDVMPVAWDARRGRLSFRPVGIKLFMKILLARDISNGTARICANPGCPTPFFVAKRRDAKFCSHQCAVSVNVKNFRQRQKKRNRR
ncbi:MAG: hypothetical protein WAN23_17620, partial [Candidatus Acidiferrales bacterium]